MHFNPFDLRYLLAFAFIVNAVIVKYINISNWLGLVFRNAIDFCMLIYTFKINSFMFDFSADFDTIFQNPVGVRTLISQETDQDRNAMITYSQHSNGTVYKSIKTYA